MSNPAVVLLAKVNHARECTRYQRGLIHTTPKDCDCHVAGLARLLQDTVVDAALLDEALELLAGASGSPMVFVARLAEFLSRPEVKERLK